MKKIYITPITEKVMVNGQTNILDTKFGNSDHVPQGDPGSGYEGEEQGAKKHYNVWDDEVGAANKGLWE